MKRDKLIWLALLGAALLWLYSRSKTATSGTRTYSGSGGGPGGGSGGGGGSGIPTPTGKSTGTVAGDIASWLPYILNGGRTATTSAAIGSTYRSPSSVGGNWGTSSTQAAISANLPELLKFGTSGLAKLLGLDAESRARRNDPIVDTGQSGAIDDWARQVFGWDASTGAVDPWFGLGMESSTPTNMDVRDFSLGDTTASTGDWFDDFMASTGWDASTASVDDAADWWSAWNNAEADAINAANQAAYLDQVYDDWASYDLGYIDPAWDSYSWAETAYEPDYGYDYGYGPEWFFDS